MREIKFRAWDEIREEMYYGYDVHTPVPTGYMELAVMQYTGNKDKHGAEIYESDLVSDEYKRLYRVVFKGDCWRCEPVKKGYVKNRWISTDLEIIGNIYEHIHLLKEAGNA